MDSNNSLSLQKIEEDIDLNEVNDENDYNISNNYIYNRNNLIIGRVVYECYHCYDVFKTCTHLNNHFIKSHLISNNFCDIKNSTIKVIRNGNKAKNVNPCKLLIKQNETKTEDLIEKSAKLIDDHIESEELKEFNCDSCDKSYNNLNSLVRHKKIHTNPEICLFPDCKKKFSTKYELEIHKWIHISNNVRDFKCDFCDKTYKNQHQLSKHKSIHTNPKRCDFPNCGKLFAESTQLKKHQLIHSEECPLRCDWPGCEFRAKLTASILAHKKNIHCNDRPFKCPDCKKAFKLAVVLRTHISRVHKKERGFGCEWPGCEKSFATKDGLENHRRTHTGEKPYSCDWPNCDQRFGHNSILQRHRFTHTGERPFHCDWPGCEAKFSSSGTLQTHKKLIHKCDYIKRSRWDNKKKTKQ